MKHFLALPAVLRTATLLASASQHVFSVQDDILAYPQYEVHLKQEWTSERRAQVLLSDSDEAHVQDANSETPPSDLEQYQQRLGTSHSSRQDDGDQPGYEHMVMDGQRWLCRVPQVKKPLEGNTGANETMTLAEEEKELARATDRGWELLQGMQDNCVYFISGWWSYRFCYNQGVKQFHQLPPSRGIPVYPPMEDPGVPGYMLGTYSKRAEGEEFPRDEGETALDMSDGAKRRRSGNGEIVQRGESRYLVQKLAGGTMCDLTGKERKIEVQFHCNPLSTDRISFIKETSTCHYLMVIQTPRLCNDIAFLPPQKDQPNAITCSPILRSDEIEDYEEDIKASERIIEETKKQWEAAEEAAATLGGSAFGPVDLPVGDIFVGEHRLVPEGVKIEKSAIVGGGKETYIDTVASSDGKVLSKEKLEELGLADTKAVDKLKKELEKIAAGQVWKLDVIDTPRGREYRGIIGDGEDEEEGAGAGAGADAGAGAGAGQKKGTKEGKSKGKGGKKTKAKKATHEKTATEDRKMTTERKEAKKTKEAEVEGSEEEYYKEEL